MENSNLDQQVQKIVLPNSVGVLVLGILSIVFCCLYGIVGFALGIIALVLASKAKKEYEAAPQKFTEGSFKNMNAGRICAIIGTSLSALWFIFMIIYVIFVVGSLAGFFSLFPWESMEAFEDLYGV